MVVRAPWRRATATATAAEGGLLGGARVGWVRPAQLVVLAFAGVALVGTLLLALPFATATGEGAGFGTAGFTAVSALSVTGLVVVDTGSHWSAFGEVVIIVAGNKLCQSARIQLTARCFEPIHQALCVGK